MNTGSTAIGPMWADFIVFVFARLARGGQLGRATNLTEKFNAYPHARR